MNLYLLTQTELKEYAGFYTECVVVADSIEKAKTIHPSNRHRWSGVDPELPWETKEWYDYRNSIDWGNLTKPIYFSKVDDWTNNLNNIEVTLLGKADSNIKQGIIISSYYSYE